MGDVVVTDTDDAAEVADAVADVAETVADAITDAVEDIVDAVEGGEDTADAIDRWVEVERRFGAVESQLDDIRTRVYQSVTGDEVRSILAEATTTAAVVAAEVAEEVAEEVADESDTLASDEDAEVTIVTPDVDEAPRKRSFWRELW